MQDRSIDILEECVCALHNDLTQLFMDRIHINKTKVWWKNYSRLFAVNHVYYALLDYKKDVINSKKSDTTLDCKIDEPHSFDVLLSALVTEHDTIIDLKLWQRVCGRKHKPPYGLIHVYSEARKRFLLSKKNFIEHRILVKQERFY